MNFQVPLRIQVLLCAVLNITLLVAALGVLFWTQFEAGFDSFLLAPTLARLREMGDQLTEELARTPLEGRANLLARYEWEYGVELGLFSADGWPLVGRVRSYTPEIGRAFGPPMSRAWSAEGERKAGRPHPKKGPPHRDGKKKKGLPHPVPVDAKERPYHPIITVHDRGSYWFGIRAPLFSPEKEDVQGGVILAKSHSLFLNGKLFELRPWLTGALFVSAVTLGCWIPFARSLTRSIRAMQEGAGQIAKGQFDVRLPAARRDEVGQLGEALNHMAGQLKGLVHGQRRFLGDIAHELSAPLARVQASIGILQDRAHPSMGKYVENVAGEVAHMSELVHDLLRFSKAGLAPKEAPREPVVVSDVVAKVLAREQAQEKVSLVAGGELAVLANEEGLFRALSNLVRNAVRYAGADGPVTIAASREKEHVLVKVSDEGPGLPEEAVDQIFTPFYRVENSRSRESGGTGLGMAIVRACVESSGGVVWCRNRKPRGLEVTLRLEGA